MRMRATWGLCWVLLVMTAVHGADQRFGQRSRGPARQRGADQRRSAMGQAKTLAAEDDPDYQAFFREMPEDRFEKAVAESSGPEQRYPQGFNFLDLDYPTGQANPTSYRLDMGPVGSSVAPGWTGITKEDLFTWERGYGWSVDAPRQDFEYQGSESLDTAKIFHYGVVQNQGVRSTFKRKERPIDIPPVRVYGDPLFFYGEHRDAVTQLKALLHAGPKRRQESTG